MTIFMFPGQGSQKQGMGDGLFDEVQEFSAIESQVDAILGFSVRELCLENPNDNLRQTQYTQPCLYVVNALHYYKAVSQGSCPTALAGHSLGEYNALLAAGGFDFLTGLRLVKKRGELMAQARGGGMLAVVGLEPAQIASVLSEEGLSGIDIANFNSPLQTVISGPENLMKAAAAALQAARATMCVPLPVSAAFHSRYMEPAAKIFDDFLGQFAFNPLQMPVIANVTAQPYPGGNPSSTIRSLLVKQMFQPVRWTHSIRYLLSERATEFREIGPGTVLTRLTQQTQSAA